MWKNLEKGFQAAFEQAWQAYKLGTIPIGAAILSQDGEIMAASHNQIFADGGGAVKFHQIAHAEINAILQLSEMTSQNVRENVRAYTLYSTMEPCPLCFGAIVMGSIRNVKFAAQDSFAGASTLNDKMDYIRNKNITFAYLGGDAEIVQIAVQVCFELELSWHNGDKVVASWEEACSRGVALGKHLFEHKILKNMIEHKFETVYNHILSLEV